jgi:hypothetical protein
MRRWRWRKEKDEVCDGGEERWKGNRSDKPNMQECAGGLFWVSGERKTWEKYGETGRGGKRLFGANRPQNPTGFFSCALLVMRACFTYLFNSTQHVYSVAMYQWRESKTSTAELAGSAMEENGGEGTTAANFQQKQEGRFQVTP